VPVFDTSAGDDVHVKNWNGDAYHAITNLFDITEDSTGTAITNNKYFNIVIWGVANKSGTYEPMMINLPDGFYNSQVNASSDLSGYDDYSMPSEFNKESSTGYLIARITIKMANTWEIIATVDLRGQTPSTATGGGSGSALTNFSDSEFSVYDNTDLTKILTFDVGDLVTTGNTRTLHVPDASGIIALTDQTDGTIDHDNLNNLTWSTAGHIIDADIDPNASGAIDLGSISFAYRNAFLNKVLLAADPTQPLHAATKQYVDASVEGNNEFIELTDTPSSYVSYAASGVKVKDDETGMEFFSLEPAINDHHTLQELEWSLAGHTIDANIDPVASGTVGLGTASLAYDDAHINKVYLEGDPTTGFEAATKNYVDNTIGPSADTLATVTTRGAVTTNDIQVGNIQIGSEAAGVDYKLTFAGEDSEGIITFMEDEFEFRTSADWHPSASGTRDLGDVSFAWDEAHIDTVHLAEDPNGPLEAATKQYVDNAVEVENLWDKSGTDLVPHTAGDDVLIASKLDTGDRSLIDSVGNQSVDWGVRSLADSSTLKSVDWETRALTRVDGTEVIKWQLMTAHDASAGTSIDWNTRTLNDSVGFDALNWEDRTLDDAAGVTAMSWAATGITIGSGAAGVDYTITFDGESNVGVITWLEDEDKFKMTCDFEVEEGSYIGRVVDSTNDRAGYFTDGTRTAALGSTSYAGQFSGAGMTATFANTGSSVAGLVSAGSQSVQMADGDVGAIVADGTYRVAIADSLTSFALDVTAGQSQFAGNVSMANAAGPLLLNEAATSANPTLVPNKADPDTGIGWQSDNKLSLITAGVARVAIDDFGNWQTTGNGRFGTGAPGYDYSLTFDANGADGQIKFLDPENHFTVDAGWAPNASGTVNIGTETAPWASGYFDGAYLKQEITNPLQATTKKYTDEVKIRAWSAQSTGGSGKSGPSGYSTKVALNLDVPVGGATYLVNWTCQVNCDDRNDDVGVHFREGGTIHADALMNQGNTSSAYMPFSGHYVATLTAGAQSFNIRWNAPGASVTGIKQARITAVMVDQQ
jgi:hypothetical protein